MFCEPQCGQSDVISDTENLDFGREQMKRAETCIADSLSRGSIAAKMSALHKSYTEGDDVFREAMALAALSRLAIAG